MTCTTKVVRKTSKMDFPFIIKMGFLFVDDDIESIWCLSLIELLFFLLRDNRNFEYMSIPLSFDAVDTRQRSVFNNSVTSISESKLLWSTTRKRCLLFCDARGSQSPWLQSRVDLEKRSCSSQELVICSLNSLWIIKNDASISKSFFSTPSSCDWSAIT